MGRGGGGSHHTCTVLMIQIPHTGTRGHATHPLHWDQRTQNTSLTLGPEDTQHIRHTGTRGHTTHPSHWDQRTHNTFLTLGPEDTQHIRHTGTRGHTTHPSHWDQRTHNTYLTLGPEDTQHIPYIGTRGIGSSFSSLDSSLSLELLLDSSSPDFSLVINWRPRLVPAIVGGAMGGAFYEFQMRLALLPFHHTFYCIESVGTHYYYR